MHLVIFFAAFMASSLALELHPGGALVPEETRAVAEARELHEAALEAAREDDAAFLASEEAFEDEERQRWWYRMCRFGCFPRARCCFLPVCRYRRMCRRFIG
jgi:hypothetical protein